MCFTAGRKAASFAGELDTVTVVPPAVIVVERRCLRGGIIQPSVARPVRQIRSRERTLLL